MVVVEVLVGGCGASPLGERCMMMKVEWVFCGWRAGWMSDVGRVARPLCGPCLLGCAVCAATPQWPGGWDGTVDYLDVRS